MSCHSPIAGVIVCGPDNRFLRRRIIRCPFCQCMREMVVRYEGWYGPTVMCTGCGDSWSDGERYQRPFRRNWRPDLVARYRALYAAATHGPAPSYEELFGEPAA